MKITEIKIRYSTTIPISSYGVNDKVDAEVTYAIDEEYQPIETIIPELKKRVDDTVRTMYPHLYAEDKIISDNSKANGVYTEPPTEQKPLLQLIQESKTIKELKSWGLLIKVEKDMIKRMELSVAFDQMHEKLTTGKTTA